MKRALIILFSLTLLFSLSACGSSTPVESAPTESKETVTTAPATQEAEITQVTESEPEMAEFAEITVVDNESCTIKITGIEPDNLWGYSLKVYLENKSSDKTFMYSVTSASINNVMADPLFAAEVAPGKKSNETVTFALDDTLAQTLGNFTDIALNFRVYDNNDWLADPVAIPSVHIYPFGEENAVTYAREAQADDVVLVDNDAVTVIATGYDPDNLWGYSINLYIVNKTTTTIMVSADEVSVNGYMLDPFYADSVDAGKTAFSTLTWFASDFEDNSIADVESIEMTLRVYDETDFLADDFAKETITLNP